MQDEGPRDPAAEPGHDVREDRRVRRTRTRLKESLLQLLGEKDYDEITVEDIAGRADVGRSTFYSHFDSKEDLLFSGFDAWVVSLAARGDGVHHPVAEEPPERETEPRFRFSLPLLHHMRANERLFRAFFLRGQSPWARRRLVAVLTETVRREIETPGSAPGVRGAAALRTRARSSARETDGQAHAIAWAFVGVVLWWLESARGMSTDAVDRVFQSAVRCPPVEGADGAHRR
jgi:AcrR family transcriptional regulator